MKSPEYEGEIPAEGTIWHDWTPHEPIILTGIVWQTGTHLSIEVEHWSVGHFEVCGLLAGPKPMRRMVRANERIALLIRNPLVIPVPFKFRFRWEPVA